jgi:DNA-binding IclR family transcriptional regulator
MSNVLFSYAEKMAATTSAARALRVLALVLDRPEIRADALAAEVGIPVSTVYRYLRDLREAGFVSELDGAYRPGPRLDDDELVETSRATLRRLARPPLERLAAGAGETALIAVRTHTYALCLDQVESHHPMRMAFRIGQALPLYAGAASRVLLAYAPAEMVQAVIKDAGPLTPATPRAEDLPRRLRAIRASGVATSRSEFVPGAIAIAVPVLSRGACACSLALAAPEQRAGAAWQRRAKELLGQARRELEALI